MVEKVQYNNRLKEYSEKNGFYIFSEYEAKSTKKTHQFLAHKTKLIAVMTQVINEDKLNIIIQY